MNNKLQGTLVARVSTVPYFFVTQLSGQIEYLSKAGAEVVVLTSDGPELSMLRDAGISVEVINIPRSINPVNDIAALIKLYGYFRKHPFDIVHSTTPKAGLLCALAGLMTCIPVRLHTFTGQPWTTLKGPVRWLAKWADCLIGRLNTFCYADSESQRAFLVAEGVVSSKRIAVLGKGSLAGVDLQRFNPSRWSQEDKHTLRRELALSPGGQVILFVGRLTRDKGLAELLGAFQSLITMGYDIDLLLVGPFDAALGGSSNMGREAIEGLRRVHHVGFTECPERYMAIADFLCLPSYREGFGTVVIEAAAMGLPTVGTSIYGLSDAVEDGVTGLLVPPKNAAALTEAMRKILDDHDSKSRMGAAARKRCIKEFESTQVNQLLVAEYSRLLS